MLIISIRCGVQGILLCLCGHGFAYIEVVEDLDSGSHETMCWTVDFESWAQQCDKELFAVCSVSKELSWLMPFSRSGTCYGVT